MHIALYGTETKDMPRKSSVLHGPLLLFLGTGITTLCFYMLGIIPSSQQSLNNSFHACHSISLLTILSVRPSLPFYPMPTPTSCIIKSSFSKELFRFPWSLITFIISILLTHLSLLPLYSSLNFFSPFHHCLDVSPALLV